MSKTITVKGTSFRSDRIAWIVRLGLSRRERWCKYALLGSSLLFLATLAWAKGTWLSLEALLAAVPLLVGLSVRTTARLASRGDSTELYEERLVQPGAEFETAAAAVRDDLLEVSSDHDNYHYMLNLREINWFSPWLYVNLKPLRVAWVFGIYAFLVSSGLELPTWPGLVDLGLLVYRPYTQPLLLGVASFVALLGLLAVGASFKRGLRLASAGGVVERLFLYQADRDRVQAALQQSWAQ